MKLFRYILEYAFLFLLSFIVLTQLGPFMLKKGLISDKKQMEKVKIKMFKLEFVNENNPNYFTLDIQLNDLESKKYFRIGEGKNKKLFDFLYQQNYLIPHKVKYRLNNTDLPIEFTHQQLELLPETFAIFNEDNGIKALIIGENLILGKTSGLLKRISLLITGILIMLAFAFIFVLSIIIFLKNVILYNKTGYFPPLPNAVEKSLEGWKIIFRINNKSEK